MKKNIGLLVVAATLAFGSTVFATSPESKELRAIEEGIVSVNENVNYNLNINLPEEYEEVVTVLTLQSFPPRYNIMVNSEDVVDGIGQVTFSMDDESNPMILFNANEEELQTEMASEVLEYIQENVETVFTFANDTVEEKDMMVTVYEGSGYLVQMPEKFEEDVLVITTRSNPPQVIFNYNNGEESMAVAKLNIVKGEYKGDGNVVKVGNGYTFVLELNEVEEADERFTEIQNYFVDNSEDLVVLAMDYDGGDKVIVVNGVEVAEYIPVGVGEYMLPLRVVSESLGMDVTWNQDTKDIDVTNGKLMIKVKPGEQTYSVNRALKQFHQTPIVKDGTTYVSLSFITDGLGLEYNIEYGTLVIS